jgi:tetratricopeptide (TPR) repeat protein
MYTFQDLGELRTLRSLREDDVPAAFIRQSIAAMQAVAGLSNPLQQATVVRTGTRLAFRTNGAMVDPIRRQLMFDFERMDGQLAAADVAPMRRPATGVAQDVQGLFLAAVQAEESGDKQRAISLYEEMLALDPGYAPAFINLGTLYFHQRQFGKAEELYRRATEADPGYVLAFFDLGNVLDELERPDESIAAYKRSVELSPRYADAHYNLALAFERKGELRAALQHWQAYVRLDKAGPWAEHARNQIRKLLDREKLSIAWRAERFVPQRKGTSALKLIS